MRSHSGHISKPLAYGRQGAAAYLPHGLKAQLAVEGARFSLCGDIDGRVVLVGPIEQSLHQSLGYASTPAVGEDVEIADFIAGLRFVRMPAPHYNPGRNVVHEGEVANLIGVIGHLPDEPTALGQGRFKLLVQRGLPDEPGRILLESVVVARLKDQDARFPFFRLTAFGTTRRLLLAFVPPLVSAFLWSTSIDFGRSPCSFST
jgi:hypothetical protein